MAQHNNHNSPHLSAHLNGSAPSSPSMSNAQQQQQQQQSGGQSRQPVSYPSPTSYPSPSLSSTQYNYPPPNNQQVSEPYRASPTGSSGSLSLPSMRSLDALQPQQQHMGSPLPPPVAQMGGPYYHNQGQTLPHPSQYPNVTSDPTGQNMRYALPVTDARGMTGGRHKKEIKRRTKTGCLTCRKRRIKCDEQHPACRNCQKSKRECLGYDPIFKQAPGPAAIQPAPSSAPSMGSSSATANPYGNQPQMLGGAYAPVSSMGYEPSLSAGVSSPGSASQQFDYASAIDPALEAAAPPTTAAAGNNYVGQPGMQAYHLASLSGDAPSANPSSSGALDIPHLRGGALSPTPHPIDFVEDVADMNSPAKRTVGDLLDLLGALPITTADVTQTPSVLEEVKHLYYSIYAPGLESFLESKWFSASGVTKLVSEKSALEPFAALLEQFAKTSSQNDPADIAYTSSIEARVVWALASMVRSTAAETNGANSGLVPANDDPIEAAHRLTVFESLLTGKVPGTNPLTQPVPGSTDHHRIRELEFWYTMGKFVCLSYEKASSSKDVDDALGTLRNLLDGRENRDVLYSVAVVRALSQRVSEYADGDQPLHLDESDNKSKLLVAKKFIMDEGAGAGTTNVIRRLCELASRSWTAPAPAALAK